jgi:hypothetical protein
MKFAGLGVRTTALLIDTVVMVGAFIIIDMISGKNYFLSNLIYQPVCALYFILLTASSLQGTLGQKVLRIKIGDMTGLRISLSQSALRYLVWSLPMLPFIVYSSLPSYGKIMDKFSTFDANTDDPHAYFAYYGTPEAQSFLFYNSVLFGFGSIAGLIWCIMLARHIEKAGPHDRICKQRAFRTDKN